jgi:hypothetical protein
LGAVPADKDNPFFWSRDWHNLKYSPSKLKWSWPLLTMYELIAENKKSVFQKGKKRCYTVEIAVLDVFKEDCTTGMAKYSACDSRTVNQIYLDTETMLDGVLQYFGGIVIATTSANATPTIYFKPWLDAQVTAGTITGYNPVYDLQNSLNAANPNTRFTRVEMPAQKIYGTKTQVVFCTTNCPDIDFNLALPDFGTLAFEAGCRDCE